MASNESVGVFATLAASIYHRRRLFVAAAALLLLGVCGSLAWRATRQSLRDDPRYRVTAASIEASPAPPWIRTDVAMEALRDAGLRGDLSVLDPSEQLQQRLAEAFRFHPWVEGVGSITKQPPNRVRVDLTYRRPLASVEVLSDDGKRSQLLAVDRYGVRLPSQDLTPAELRYLPRVRGVASATLPGEVWSDARVLGAVSLIAALGERWTTLNLDDVVPSRSTEVLGDFRYYVFNLVSRGGTRIVWGAAPNATPPGESPFAAKLTRLEQFVSQHGPLRTTYGTPEVIDVRNGITVKDRTAQLPKGSDNEAATLKK